MAESLETSTTLSQLYVVSDWVHHSYHRNIQLQAIQEARES